MVHTEASLKGLTVLKLKDILAKHSLPVSGKKDELVARLLDNPSALESSDSPAPETAAPDPASVDAPALPKPAPTPAVATDAAAAAPPAPTPAPEPVVPILTPEEKQAKLDAEEERRKKRAERFGIPAAEEGKKLGGEDEALKKRAERFGIEKKEKEGKSVAEKSVEKLDLPLGAKAPREKKVPTPAAPKAEPKPVDPELAAKLAQEEEKKRKRAERFGAPAATTEPDAKKAKVDT